MNIPEAERRFDEYPHQLSGGMRQRVMIALALACGPRLLFADEPTTALDVTVQAEILNLLQDQQTDRFMAMVLVTHDLGVVAGRTDEIAVMYAGRIVEQAPTSVLFSHMLHPYTEALLRSIPKVEDPSHTRLRVITGRPPDLTDPPPGCKFAPRCPYVQERCRVEEPHARPSPARGAIASRATSRSARRRTPPAWRRTSPPGCRRPSPSSMPKAPATIDLSALLAADTLNETVEWAGGEGDTTDDDLSSRSGGARDE